MENKKSVCNKTGKCLRQQSFPSLSYELRILITRKSCAHPDIQKHNSSRFHSEPKSGCSQNKIFLVLAQLSSSFKKIAISKLSSSVCFCQRRVFETERESSLSLFSVVSSSVSVSKEKRRKAGNHSFEFIFEEGKRKWPFATPKKENAGESSYQNHISVFSNKKESKSYRCILYIVPSNQLCFRFRKVYWSTVEFCQGANNPHDKDWPERKKKRTACTRKRLRFNHSALIQTVCKETSCQNNQSKRLFITNYLRHRSTAALKSISTISRPPCQLNSIDTLASDCKNVYCSLRKLSDCTCSTCWKPCPSDLTRLKGLDWSPIVQGLIGIAGHNWFFEKQFLTIQKGLQNTKSTYCVRTYSTLYRSYDATLDQSQKSDCKQLRNNCCLDYYNQIQDHHSLCSDLISFAFH